MKTAFAAIIILIVCISTMNCCSAQIIGPFYPQYVGGEFGRGWLTGFQSQNKQPIEGNLQNGLWTWGGTPKGSIAVNGKLVPDPYYFWRSLNYSSGWLGRVYTDPYTGYPVYAYIDPHTGGIVHFCVDPDSKRPVYSYPGAFGFNTGYGSAFPYY